MVNFYPIIQVGGNQITLIHPTLTKAKICSVGMRSLATFSAISLIAVPACFTVFHMHTHKRYFSLPGVKCGLSSAAIAQQESEIISLAQNIRSALCATTFLRNEFLYWREVADLQGCSRCSRKY